MLIVGLPPLAWTRSSGSYNVLPSLWITLTPAFLAISMTAWSLSRAYASVSFSNTRCEIFHSLKIFPSTVCGASRTTKSLDLGFNFVIDFDRSDWQSRLDLY